MNARRIKFLKSIAASKVLTPNGKKLLSDIKVGDIVIGADDNGRLEQRVAQVKRFVGVHNTIYINESHAFSPHQSLFVFRDGKKLVLHALLVQKGDYIYTESGRVQLVTSVKNIDHPLKIKRIALDLEEVNPVKRIALKIYNWITNKPKFNRSYYLDGVLVHNATRFWVGGTGNWDGSDTSHWSATTGGASGASVPTSSDSVTFDGNSGTTATVTITGASANASSITINKSDLTLLHNNGATVTGIVTLTTGTLNTNGQTCSWGALSSNNSNTRTITLGASTITLTGASQTVWNTTTNTNLTSSMASSTIVCNATAQTFSGQSAQQFGTVTMSGSTASVNGTTKITTLTITSGGSGSVTLSGTITTTNFERSGGSNLTLVGGAGTLVVSGNFTLAGVSAASRLIVQTSAIGSPRGINNTGATHIWSYVDIQDISFTAPYDASAITGGSGDCGGTTNITFTTGATQDLTMSTAKNWNDPTIWSGRIPLPQDDVTATGWTGGNLTVNISRVGRNMDFTAASATANLGYNGSTDHYGDLLVPSTITFTGAGNPVFRGRSSHSITSSGRTFTSGGVNFQPRGGSYQLNDALTASGPITITGTFNSNNFNITGTTVGISGITSGSLGTSIITCTSTAAATVFTGGGSATTSDITIIIATVSANVRTIAGAGKTYKKIQYTITGSTGGLDISGSNTYLDGVYFWDPSNARTLRFVAATTQTAYNWSSIYGTAGKLMTVDCTTAATFNIAFTGVQGTMSTDYVNFKNTVGLGTGANYYAGPNSTNGGGNTNIQFKACPICSAFMDYF